jgi:hypothetical protein
MVIECGNITENSRIFFNLPYKLTIIRTLYVIIHVYVFLWHFYGFFEIKINNKSLPSGKSLSPLEIYIYICIYVYIYI